MSTTQQPTVSLPAEPEGMEVRSSLTTAVKIQVGLSVLATVVTIILASLIPGLLSRKASLESDIGQLQRQKAQLQQETQQLRTRSDQTAAAFRSLANTTAASLSPQQAQQAIEQSVNASPEAAKILPRIFIHIRAASQRPRASEIAATLRQQGYIVPGVEILVDKGPSKTQVRYFHSSDEEGAAKIADQLSKLGVSQPQTQLVSNYPNVRSSQYEIWFAPDSL